MDRQPTKWGLIDWLILLVVLIPIIAAVLVYDRLPEQMVAHFGPDFQPDRYQDKLSLLITVSAVSFLPVVLKYLRRIDPKRDNYLKFTRAFNIIRLATALVLSIAFGSILLYGLGYALNMQKIVFLMLGVFFLVIGNYLGQIRYNFLTGIRTPRTLADEEVWRRTHRLAGPLWMFGGLLAVVSAFLPLSITMWILGFAGVVVIVIPLVASYFYFRNR